MRTNVLRACFVVVVAMGAGCGARPDGGEPGAAQLAPPRADGLRIGAPVELSRLAAAAKNHFRAAAPGKHGTLGNGNNGNIGNIGLTASGLGHALEVGESVVRIRSAARPFQREALTGRARGTLPASAAGAPSRSRVVRAQLDALRAGTAPALELETVSIGRPGFQCVSGKGRVVAGAGGGAVRDFGACSERWTNGPDAGEVAFQFPERPAGRGDLVVAVRASLGGGETPTSVASDARGLHLAGANGARFFYGHATWIDADGRRTSVPARWTDRGIELRVPADTVDASRFPAVLDPVVGPDLGTDRPVLTPASGGLDPDVATDGSNFLVVFEDFQRIRAVRADAAGNLLTFDWIDLGEDGKLQFVPNVAFGGGHYLVTWWEDDGTILTVKGRVLDADGTPLGAANFAISAEDAIDDAVAWNGERFLVTWTGFGDPLGIRVAGVDVDGNVIAGSQQTVSLNAWGHPRIAAGATASVVAWEAFGTTGDFTNRVYAARVAPDGTVLDPGGFRLSSNETDETQIKLASSGDAFLLAWRRAGDLSTIQGAVLSDGGVITTPDFTISRSTGFTSVPGVAFDGAKYLVAWADERDVPAVFGAPISVDGVALSTEDVRLSTVPVSVFSFNQTALAWNGSRFLVVFLGDRVLEDFTHIGGVEGSLVTPDLTIERSGLSFTQLINNEFASQVVWNGQDYVVIWSDEREGGFDRSTVRAVRITTAGQVLDPDGILLSDDLRDVFGHIASNGDGRSVVTMVDPAGQSFERMLGADGTLTPLQIPSTQALGEGPAVASNGQNYLMVFGPQTPDSGPTDILGRIVRANGNLGPQFRIQRNTDLAGVGVVAVDGGDYLVSAFRNNQGFAIPVSRGGDVGDRIPLPLSSSVLSAASSGRNALVAWTGQGSFEVSAQLYNNGAFRRRTLQIAPVTAGYVTALAWDGVTYWAVWVVDNDAGRPFIRSISDTGVLGPVSQLLDDQCLGPSLASNGQRQLLLTCYKFSSRFRIVRVTTRLIDTSVAAAP